MFLFTKSLRRFGAALACGLAAAAIGVPLAQGFTVITEHSASQNRVESRNAYGPPDPWMYPFLHSSSSSGDHLITENSASQNRLSSSSAIASTRAAVQRYGLGDFRIRGRDRSGSPSVVAISGGTGFQWGDAAIGAAASAGALLLLAGCSLILLRRRGVLAH